ncbi:MULTISPECIES: Maf family protein [Salinivibrio]|nr:MULTISPECIES: Maf family protein [Salinivibrio]OOF20350.1 septum formation inhibitor Maf [Salinivibrio sp. IB574]PCE68761.1 septum formation inhibitor Maf [Salinivibrio sp. YCSC6]ODQ00394.1 septum formation inhibitor Maf [Salinivibrio sp. DV]OOF22334.1 septum formation inhibitor Maf [Salinivibrio proteolyticus]OOF26641.1 septum formation inhibitor Maf [Salinivibrio sp. IB872]
MSIDLYLASGSPRRQALLTDMGINFSRVVVDVEEQQKAGESPYAYVSRLSQDKARAGVAKTGGHLPVLGADTIVVDGEQVLEKPRDEADGARMLKQLSGREHQVMTAVTVANAMKQVTTVVTTRVWFRELTDDDIRAYWQSKEPMDKAGGYAIQGLGGKFVTRIDGSYHAVVGLPLYETEQLLKQFMA